MIALAARVLRDDVGMVYELMLLLPSGPMRLLPGRGMTWVRTRRRCPSMNRTRGPPPRCTQWSCRASRRRSAHRLTGVLRDQAEDGFDRVAAGRRPDSFDRAAGPIPARTRGAQDAAWRQARSRLPLAAVREAGTGRWRWQASPSAMVRRRHCTSRMTSRMASMDGTELARGVDPHATAGARVLRRATWQLRGEAGVAVGSSSSRPREHDYPPATAAAPGPVAEGRGILSS